MLRSCQARSCSSGEDSESAMTSMPPSWTHERRTAFGFPFRLCLLRRPAEASETGEWADVVPVSAKDGFQVDLLADLLVRHLPPGRALYPDGELTDEPERVMVAELIREAALEGVRDELPHSIAVVVEEMAPRPDRTDGLIDIYAHLFLERESQKGIVIGHKGSRLKAAGARARRSIDALLGSPVY